MPDLSKSPRRIAAMFDAIAARYDFLNHLLSAGLDRRWRRQAVRTLALTGRERILDVCTGTADLAMAAARRGPAARQVIGVDFAAAMLQVAQKKLRGRRLVNRVALVRGDAMSLPLRGESVDAVTMAFGIRNVDDPAAAFREIRRVLVPGGRVAILEFALPTVPFFRPVYLWYLNHVLPRIGRIISRDTGAYGYLPASIGAFATPEELVTMLRHSALAEISAVRLTFGSVILYTATKAKRHKAEVRVKSEDPEV